MIVMYWMVLLIAATFFLVGCDMSFDEPTRPTIAQEHDADSDEPEPEPETSETVIVTHKRCPEVRALFMDYGASIVCKGE